MGSKALSRILAASTLAGALWVYTRDLGVYGPLMFYPFVGAPAVAGMMGVRAALVRKLGGGADPTARALEVIALGAMLAPGAGYLLANRLDGMPGGRCGLLDASMVATVLGRSWPIWGAVEVGGLVALARHRVSMAPLRAHQLLATVLTLVAAPPLLVLACVATGFETYHAGAGVIFVLPAAIAAGSTVAAWTLRRSFATGIALRRIAATVLILGVPLSLALRSREPVAQDCVSFSTTTTWGLLADVGCAAAPLLAVMLSCARDPVAPRASSEHGYSLPEPIAHPFPSLPLTASALLLLTSWLLLGPMFLLPLVGGPVVLVVLAIRIALERQAGNGPDATARALEVLAFGAIVAFGAGALILVAGLHDRQGDRCGLMGAAAVGNVLGRWWPWWVVGEVLVLVSLTRRRAAVARLRRYHAVATILVLVAAPPLAVLASFATACESNHGGAGVTFLVPVAVAAGSTLGAWVRGRSYAVGTHLRRLAVAILIVAAPMSLALRYRAPLSHNCTSFATTATWSLLAEVGWAVAPCLAFMLHFARDPVSPTAGVSE